MVRKSFASLLTVAIVFLWVLGITRASTRRYEERQKALLVELAAEQQRLGLTDRAVLFAKYPTPEITLCRMTRVLPGATGEVVLRGKFAPATKFLFENDSVEVVKEVVTATEYRATVRVPPGIGPSYAFLYAYAPVSGANARCSTLYIGGKYQWDFTAENGWRILLRMLDERFSPDADRLPDPLYRAEFYRGSEPKPFETLQVALSLDKSPWEESYSGSLREPEAGQSSAQAEMQKLMEKIAAGKLSQEEMEKLSQRLQELSEQTMRELQATMTKMSSPDYAKEVERKEKEFGCHYINARLTATGAEGNLTCGEKVATVLIKGTMKFVGP